jgi:hypothetical protein
MRRFAANIVPTMALAVALAVPHAQAQRVPRPAAPIRSCNTAPPVDPAVYASARLKPPSYGTNPDNCVFRAVGSLRPGAGEKKSFVLPELDAVKMMLFGNGLSWSFQSPAGKTIVPGKTNLGTGEYGDTGLGFAVFSLEHPEQGPWTLDIAAPQSDTAVSYAILIDADGAREEVAHIETMPREGDPGVSFQARPGDPVFIRTFVSRNGRPVPGVQWDVRAVTLVDSCIAIPVFDDGRHADGGAKDGIHVGAILARDPYGSYRIVAEGRTPRGVEYVVTGDVQVESQNDLLIADTIAVSPKEPRVGEPVKLAVTVKGDGSADNRDVELELRVGGDPESTQRFDLRAGESRLIVTTWKPRAAGTYHVLLTVNCWMEGDNYENNSREAIVRVR